MPTKITQKQKVLLLEAARRWLLKPEDHTGGQTLTTAWTGLGTCTEYKAVTQAGLMCLATGTAPAARVLRWWQLTDTGADIVQEWLDQGLTITDFDGWNCTRTDLLP